MAAYATRGCEESFAILVRRHISLVYAAALRQLGNPQQAEDVTQAVFTVLARKASRLRTGTILQGWLFRAARLASLRLMRTEARRRRREEEAMQSENDGSQPDLSWEEWAPLLDEAMSRLGELERDAVLLRYFEGCSCAQAALALRSSEAAIQKRASRGVEKLRTFFARRGFAISSSALIAGLSLHSLQAAPPGLALNDHRGGAGSHQRRAPLSRQDGERLDSPA